MKTIFFILLSVFFIQSTRLKAQTNRELLQRSVWKWADIKNKDYSFYKKFSDKTCHSIFRNSNGKKVDNPACYILSKTKGTNTLSFQEQKLNDNDMGTFVIIEVEDHKIFTFEILKLTADSLVARSVIYPNAQGEYIGNRTTVKYIAVPEVGK